MRPKIEAVLFDVGIVLVELELSRLTDRLDFSLGEFQNWEPYDEFERGKLTETQFVKSVNERLGSDFTQDTFREWWNSILIGPVPGVPEMLRELSEEIPVFALTNTTPTHFDYLCQKFDWLNPISRIYTSFDLGARKPEKAIYEGVCEAISLPPSQVLFIDDRAENVHGARAVGMCAEQTSGNIEATRLILSTYGL